MQLSSHLYRMFVEAIGCERLYFLEFNRRVNLWGMFLLSAKWAHELMDVYVNIDVRRA